MFVLEDRVTARTNSGENEPEGNPNNTPEASTVVGSIVGTTPPSQWDQNITDQILELKVCTMLKFAFQFVTAAAHMMTCSVVRTTMRRSLQQRSSNCLHF